MRFHSTTVDDKGRNKAYLADAGWKAGTLYHLLTRRDTATHWGRLKAINLSNGSKERRCQWTNPVSTITSNSKAQQLRDKKKKSLKK